jgi:hypothetical protein
MAARARPDHHVTLPIRDREFDKSTDAEISGTKVFTLPLKKK